MHAVSMRMRAWRQHRRRKQARSFRAAGYRRWTRSPPSEPFAQPCLLEWMRVVRSGHLAAEPRRRKDLPRIAETLRIEGPAHREHDVEIVVREHLRHVFGL